MFLTKDARRAIILRRGWFPGCYALCRNAVSMGQKKSHRGNPVGFFIPSRAFLLPFFGGNAAHFSRVTFAPYGNKKPHPKQIFSRSRQTQNCKLDLGSLLARRHPNRAQWWKEPC